MPVFMRVLAQTPAGKCKNCAGAGWLFITFCKNGPYKTPPAIDVGTWWEGNGQFPKGWYTVEDTISYECPACKKIGG